MDPLVIAFVIAALMIGFGAGFALAGRAGAALKAERDQHLDNFRKAIVDLAGAEERAKAADDLRATLAALQAEHGKAQTELATVRAGAEERERSFQAQLDQLREAKEALAAQFSEIGGKLLGEAQKAFLERADARFKQSEELSGKELKALLQPVTERLERYEKVVAEVEDKRTSAYGELKGIIAEMRVGQERVSSETAKLVNSLRNAPKARGRWGEQQLRNVLEMAGLSAHADFQSEVSVDTGDGRLRPDVIVRLPGGRQLIIDAKCSLNAYLEASEQVDDAERARHLALHASAIRNHANQLGAKAYWSQFGDAADYVVMFIPGEHFLSAALEQDHELWQWAFERRVLLATPTNLIAIARTVSAVWRQEKLAEEAAAIGALGKELHARLATMGAHIAKLGRNLELATGAYNSFVGSLESQVMTQAKRFEALEVAGGTKEIEELPVVEASPRPLTKLVIANEAS